MIHPGTSKLTRVVGDAIAEIKIQFSGNLVELEAA